MFNQRGPRYDNIRLGTISSVNALEASVRVHFEDKGDAVSAELPLVFLQTGKSQFYSLPEVGERVVCVFLSSDMRAGFCLGSFYTIKNPPPTGEAATHGVWFPDGSHVYYDQASSTLHLKAQSKVLIDGDLHVTGTITDGGG